MAESVDSVLDRMCGVFASGYTPEDITRELGAISAASGVQLVCVWDYKDYFGFGGDSEFFLVEDDVVYHLDGDLWPWLLDGRAGAPNGPGEPSRWKGQRASFTLDELPFGDGDNCAHRWRE